jgi:ubiquinone biosynthesis protein
MTETQEHIDPGKPARTEPGQAARRRARYREIARILWEERLFDALKGIGLEEQFPVDAVMPSSAETRERDLPRPVRIRRALERLGPVFIKVGQMLATRADLVPPSLLKELLKLQDAVQPTPWPEMKKCIETELGKSTRKLFRSIRQTPLAAASIGQVYRAVLPDGTKVAVKVRRPGVIEALDLDLEILNNLALRLANHARWARDNRLAEVVAELSTVLRAEADYGNEALNLDRFRAAFADDDSLVIPRVYWDRTSDGVLTMELIEGVPGTSLENRTAPEGIDRARLVQLGVGAYFRMIFQLGFYHADPHAGNLLALPEGRLGLVDFGRVGTLSERYREGTFDMLLAMLGDDSTAVADTVLSMTGMPPEIDLAAFEVDISTLLDQFRKQQERNEGFGELMEGFLRLLGDHHLHVPEELSLLLSTLGVLDGVAHQIDPDFRMLDVTEEAAPEYIPEHYGPRRAWRRITKASRAYGRLLDQFPVEATRALRRMGEGEFKLVVRPSEYEHLLDRLSAMVSLLAYSLILGALIIGFAFLAGRQGLARPETIGYKVVLFLAVASVVGLLAKAIRNQGRRRRMVKRSRQRRNP